MVTATDTTYVSAMLIRPASPQDASAIWRIIQPIIRAGETYTLDRNMSEDDATPLFMAVHFSSRASALALGLVREASSTTSDPSCSSAFLRAHNAAGAPTGAMLNSANQGTMPCLWP